MKDFEIGKVYHSSSFDHTFISKLARSPHTCSTYNWATIHPQNCESVTYNNLKIFITMIIQKLIIIINIQYINLTLIDIVIKLSPFLQFFSCFSSLRERGRTLFISQVLLSHPVVKWITEKSSFWILALVILTSLYQLRKSNKRLVHSRMKNVIIYGPI